MKKRLGMCALIGMSAMLVATSAAQACTGVIVGKQLTEDGTALFGRVEDYPYEPHHNKLFLVHERTENKDRHFEDVNGFTWELPEVSYKYTTVPDITPDTEGIFGEAGFNEHGVAMDATVSAEANDKVQEVDPYVPTGIGEESVTSIVLPSVKTAREGAELIAKMVKEKGAKEGNIIVLADQKEIWYVEILSGHQYAAIKFPDDKFAVMSNAYWLGALDVNDKDNVIASEKLVDIAKEAGTLEEVDGKIHVSRSYNPDYSDGVRSRQWAGQQCLIPQSEVSYDENFELFKTTDRKISLKDIMAMQRNRFEGTEYRASDEKVFDEMNNKKLSDDKYKYPIGNRNTIEGHIFQMKDNVPAEVGGTMWLAMSSPVGSPYIPFYGNITETIKPYQVNTFSYDPTSYYWSAEHLNGLVAENRDKYGQQVTDKWHALEDEFIKKMAETDKMLSDKYATSPEEAAKYATELANQAATDTFKQLKETEESIAKEVEAGQETKLTDDTTKATVMNSVGTLRTATKFEFKQLDEKIEEEQLKDATYQVYEFNLTDKDGNKVEYPDTTYDVVLPTDKKVSKVLYIDAKRGPRDARLLEGEAGTVKFTANNLGKYVIVYE